MRTTTRTAMAAAVLLVLLSSAEAQQPGDAVYAHGIASLNFDIVCLMTMPSLDDCVCSVPGGCGCRLIGDISLLSYFVYHLGEHTEVVGIWVAWDNCNTGILVSGVGPWGSSPDADDDGIPDYWDNCPGDWNPEQYDDDGDGIGNICDECTDRDGDGFGDPGFAANSCPDDNCPSVANPDQSDSDSNGIGDVCDCCTNRGDTDQNGLGPDIADLVYTAAFMFHNGPHMQCVWNGDADGNGSFADIADLVYMVSYMFQGGPAPMPCP